MRRIPSALFLSALVLLSACDLTTPSVHRPEPVVEAYLIAGDPFARIRLTYTDDLEGIYDPGALGIAGAAVRVHELTADGAIATTITYAPVPDSAGVYRAVSPGTVRASTRYRLDVALATGEQVTAETFVPGPFDFVGESQTVQTYQDPDQLSVEVTESVYPGRQSIYVVAIEAMDPRPGNLTPFFLDALYEIDPDDEYDPDTLDVKKLEDLIVASSPPVNEESWERVGTDRIRIKLPWFAVAFFGPLRVVFYAIDDNLYDFIRFQSAQQGGSTLSPGELPNVKDAVDGGTGVFAGLVRQSIDITILRPE